MLQSIIDHPTKIVLAAILVYLVVMILGRAGLAGEIVNEWWNKFTLGGVVSDMATITFGIFLALVLFKYVFPAKAFTPVNFVLCVVAIQMTHDLMFGLLLRVFPKNRHRMMDLLRRYSNTHGWKILIVDALIMIATVLLICAFVHVDNLVIYMMLALALYVAPYLIYV